MVLIAAVVLAVGAALSVGAIAFIGLLAPNIARACGAAHPRKLLPASAVIGAVLLAGSDALAVTMSRAANEVLRAEATSPLPAGAITAMIGGPVLVALMMKTEKA